MSTSSGRGVTLEPNFRNLVISFVKAVPAGKVATYGQIAALAGSPRAARQVGAVLNGLKKAEDVPWQRVINASGGLSTYKIGYGEMQKALLTAEGVKVSAANTVDLSVYLWRPDDETEQGRLF